MRSFSKHSQTDTHTDLDPVTPFLNSKTNCLLLHIIFSSQLDFVTLLYCYFHIMSLDLFMILVRKPFLLIWVYFDVKAKNIFINLLNAYMKYKQRGLYSI